MGTSGSYGGSGSGGWGSARRAFERMPDPRGDADRPTTQTEPPTAQPDAPSDQPAAPSSQDVAAAIANALWTEDTQVRIPAPPRFPLGSLVPRRPGGGGGGAGGGGVRRGTTGTSGRTGGRSTRQVAKGAQRGAAAIAAAYAVRRGDAAFLADLGIELADLAGLDPLTQTARLLDAVLGEAGHPDERALRKASLEQMKRVLRAEVEPTPLEALRGLVGSYVFELGVIELRAQMKAGSIDVNVARRKEAEIRSYIETRTRQLGTDMGPIVTREQFTQVAGRLTTETLRVLRAGSAAA